MDQDRRASILTSIDTEGSKSGAVGLWYRSEELDRVEELICSQEKQSGQHLSTREIASELGISDRPVRCIAKKDLHLNAFHRVPAQVLNASTKQKRLHRSTALLRRLHVSVRDVKRVFFTNEKIYT